MGPIFCYRTAKWDTSSAPPSLIFLSGLFTWWHLFSWSSFSGTLQSPWVQIPICRLSLPAGWYQLSGFSWSTLSLTSLGGILSARCVLLGSGLTMSHWSSQGHTEWAKPRMVYMKFLGKLCPLVYFPSSPSSPQTVCASQDVRSRHRCTWLVGCHPYWRVRSYGVRITPWSISPTHLTENIHDCAVYRGQSPYWHFCIFECIQTIAFTQKHWWDITTIFYTHTLTSRTQVIWLW